MLFKRINRNTPEQIFVIVKNEDTRVQSTGHAVCWNYALGTTTGNGYGVILPYASTTGGYNNPGLVAGVVAGKDIQVGEFGTVQCYGHNNNIAVTGFNALPMTTYAITATTSSANYLLRPLNCISTNQITTPTSALGYWGLCAVSTSINTTTGLETPIFRILSPGGYIVPTDYFYLSGTTAWTSDTVSTTTYTGSTRGFIHCM